MSAASAIRRAAFLAGQGTLTEPQLREWACELDPSLKPWLTDRLPADTLLMVAVVRED